MPLHQDHQRKKRKNLVMLAVLAGAVALMYALTIIKMTP